MDWDGNCAFPDFFDSEHPFVFSNDVPNRKTPTTRRKTSPGTGCGFGPPAPREHGGTAMFGQLFQPMHLLLVVGIALLVFGPGKLPQLGASIGKSIRELRKGLDGTPDQPAQPTQPTQSTDTRK